MSGQSTGGRSDDALDRRALRSASLTGVRWSSATRLLAEILAFGASVALARLIAPAEFGVAAVALALAAIAPALAGAGFGVPLVQLPSLDKAHLEVATVLSVLTGLFFTLLTIFVVSPFAVEPLFGGRVAYLLELVSPTFVLAGIGVVPNAQLQRQLSFRRLSEIELASIAITPAISIPLAAATSLGAEAIVLGGVGAATVATLLTYLSALRVGVSWSRAHVRDLVGIGLFAAPTALIIAVSRNVQYAFVGARLPPREVGLFWRAYQLAVGYPDKAGAITLRLAFPIFSRAESLDDMRHVRTRILQIQSIVLFPLLTILIVVAPEVVPLVYGEDWQGAARAVQILAVAGMASVAASAGDPMAFAAGKGRALFSFNLMHLGGFSVIVLWASGYGITTVAIAIAVYQLVAVVWQFIYLESRHVGVPLRETWDSLVPATTASALALVAAYPTVRMLLSGADDTMLVFVGAGLTAGLYLLVLRLGFPTTWFGAAGLLRALTRPESAEVNLTKTANHEDAIEARGA